MSPILVPTLDELGVEFEKAFAVERATPVDAGGYEAARMYLDDVCSQIAELPAQTAAHVRLKARALDWYSFADHSEPLELEPRLTYQLVRALLDGVPS